ncbi:type II secretion system protein GspC [Psychromonas sp. KJ10-10]|uniref:type II secretion system protein GspC n=1 Tax=Psychromonas sp. KJ10-10 TaxID=3391823 RepID=UPI0039B4510A
MPLASFLQKIPAVVLAIFIALLAYQFALLTWSFVPEDKPASQWKPAIVKNKQSANKINTQKVEGLFGQKAEQKKAVVAEVDINDAPKTRLNLKLVGVVASTDPQFSSVIIDNKGRQNSYFIDSEIEGTDAVITKIYQDRTILDVKGSYQTLMLDGVEGLDKQQQAHQRNNQSARLNQAKYASESDVRTVNLNRQELLKNPAKLGDFIRISPVRENDQVKGYRVNPGKDKSIFEEAGLQSGDLAVELNGVDLTDTQQAFTLMQEFPTMTDMTLSVERDGQLHELYFSIPE